MGQPEAPPDFTPLFGRSQQLAELEQLAAELSSGARAPSPLQGAGAEQPAPAEAAHRQAAMTLLEPLGELKKRMEGCAAIV